MALCALAEHDCSGCQVQVHVLLLILMDQIDVDANYETWFAWLLLIRFS